MANALLEKYAQRIALANDVHKRSHLNESMPQSKSIAIATCLNNVSKFLTESFENSVGTQRTAMGSWKKFALNLTNVALPNLIAFDLVIVQPMTSYSGYINYLQYTYGSNKGGAKQGDVINNPFKLGKVDTEYTSERVAEMVTVGAEGKAMLAWAPVVNTETVKPELVGAAEGATIEVINAKTGEVKITGVTGDVKVRYVYDNIVIPQNDLPILNAEMKMMPLVAKARRIAVYYSQIAAYQAKQDYEVDLEAQLAEKAVGELAYEIDTEITQLLIDNADSDEDLVWSKSLPTGVSKAEHYEGFSEILEIAKQRIYDRTQKFAPNYMLIASNVLPILVFMKGFSAAPVGTYNGPYFAGTLNGLKVFVTPNIQPGKFLLGVNGNDMVSSAAVYAPYMAVVPTQLLQFADGGNSQGWSTLYALELLNKDLLIAGRITA
ncbi:hypothetical protein [uncultured Clostridium sp.]|uniref:hypothetical protein n=1 Tax=uncultured Clostridium sp. TaxID=59620 RepID=UPI0026252A3B|nr:hypothetical protein [uncultured Clostridium sp.]